MKTTSILVVLQLLIVAGLLFLVLRNPYDLNRDGKVDLTDVSILMYHYSK